MVAWELFQRCRFGTQGPFGDCPKPSKTEKWPLGQRPKPSKTVLDAMCRCPKPSQSALEGICICPKASKSVLDALLQCPRASFAVLDEGSGLIHAPRAWRRSANRRAAGSACRCSYGGADLSSGAYQIHLDLPLALFFDGMWHLRQAPGGTGAKAGGSSQIVGRVKIRPATPCGFQ